MKLAGLASNRGRNLRNLHELAPGGAEIGVVLSNHSDAPVLDWAAENGVPAEVVVRDDDGRRRDHDRRVADALEPYAVDLVCLDGYMRVLSEAFLEPMPTTLNVHPSLLPSFPGMDAWGDALNAGVKVVGATVHVVTNAVDEEGNVVQEDVDGGPIVTQEPIPVYEGDDRRTLADRVLYGAEFRAYPRAVRWFARDDVEIDRETNVVRVPEDEGGRFPARRLASDDRVRQLRYGENPHQDAALFADPTAADASVVGAEQLNPDAKGLSYNNYNDANAALALIREFDEPAAAVIKHANPAGCAVAGTLSDAYDRALRTDPMSAFGGVVALNRPCDAPTAEEIVDSFKEVVVAPGYDEEALSILSGEGNLRVLDVGELGRPGERPRGVVEKPLSGGRLVQDRDDQRLTVDDLEVVTERDPTAAQLETMTFAWPVVKHVTSNAIVFATGTETVGVGMGQVSRVDAVRLAAMKADEHAEGKLADGAVMASDAFFPFPDGVEVAAQAGVEAVVQPGGSVNDDDIVTACDELGVAMAFTGRRAFRHG